MRTITYSGNDAETYSIIQDGEPVAEILTGEDGAMGIVDEINEFIKAESEYADCIVIQNDDEKLGLIADAYSTITNDLVNTMTIWFEDYID